jgi:hypothetical protein
MARHKFSAEAVQSAKKLMHEIIQTMKKRGMTELEPGYLGGGSQLGYEEKLPGIHLLPLVPFYGKFMYTYSTEVLKIVDNRLVFHIRKHSCIYNWASTRKEECYLCNNTYRDYEFDELLDLHYRLLDKSKNPNARLESEFIDFLLRAREADPENDPIEAAKLPKMTDAQVEALIKGQEQMKRSKKKFRLF